MIKDICTSISSLLDFFCTNRVFKNFKKLLKVYQIHEKFYQRKKHNWKFYWKYICLNPTFNGINFFNFLRILKAFRYFWRLLKDFSWISWIFLWFFIKVFQYFFTLFLLRLKIPSDPQSTKSLWNTYQKEKTTEIVSKYFQSLFHFFSIPLI